MIAYDSAIIAFILITSDINHLSPPTFLTTTKSRTIGPEIITHAQIVISHRIRHTFMFCISIGIIPIFYANLLEQSRKSILDRIVFPLLDTPPQAHPSSCHAHTKFLGNLFCAGRFRQKIFFDQEIRPEQVCHSLGGFIRFYVADGAAFRCRSSLTCSHNVSMA